MAEDARHDRQVLALLDEQRGAGVTHVVEALPGQSGSLQRSMEQAGHVPGIERRTDRGREYVSEVLPARPGREPLKRLEDDPKQPWDDAIAALVEKAMEASA